MTYNLTLAKLDDVPALVSLSRELWEQMPYGIGKAAFLDWKIEGTFRGVINQGISENCIIMVDKSGELIGAIGASHSEPLWNTDKHAVELFFFVRPGHKRAAVLLIDAFEEWARRTGCKGIHLGIDNKNRRTSKGFVSAEQMYYKDLI